MFISSEKAMGFGPRQAIEGTDGLLALRRIELEWLEGDGPLWPRQCDGAVMVSSGLNGPVFGHCDADLPRPEMEPTWLDDCETGPISWAWLVESVATGKQLAALHSRRGAEWLARQLYAAAPEVWSLTDADEWLDQVPSGTLDWTRSAAGSLNHGVPAQMIVPCADYLKVKVTPEGEPY